ncbi:MAG: type II toxin-antitoxin system RelE/ParE family toxin [Betaproteobacteria bacterium]|nr:MAG: type II toxin-antitoxin system RelE/ParE family toxin [Betaproteobacteria bacterium]
MPAVEYSARALADLERLAEFLVAADPAHARGTVALIMDALDLLRLHPLVGRPVEQGLRELVISRGRTGYVALYKYDEASDRVTVHAIRHQREAGYAI